METQNAPAYFKSNTGYRFISKNSRAYQIKIPRPEGGYLYRNLGYLKVGEEQGLRNAIRERNKLGKELWKGFWHRVVSNWLLLARLPRDLEPKLYNAPDTTEESTEYRARWTTYEVNGEKEEHCRRYSCAKHGKLGAYSLAKTALQEAHKPNLSLLAFMGRTPIVKLK
ncbi:hypothetical protein AKH08_16755 [Vibrio parahaemolyticus]|nr:hypothetical protein AKH08_16755 [Vibrio parahaemolyticus]